MIEPSEALGSLLRWSFFGSNYERIGGHVDETIAIAVVLPAGKDLKLSSDHALQDADALGSTFPWCKFTLAVAGAGRDEPTAAGVETPLEPTDFARLCGSDICPLGCAFDCSSRASGQCAFPEDIQNAMSLLDQDHLERVALVRLEGLSNFSAGVLY
jgi:hypothetical protein